MLLSSYYDIQHFYHFREILTLLHSQHAPSIPNNHCYTSFHHWLALPILEHHIHGTIQYVLFLFLASFTHHNVSEVHLCGLCMNNSFLFLFLSSIPLYKYDTFGVSTLLLMNLHLVY